MRERVVLALALVCLTAASPLPAKDDRIRNGRVDGEQPPAARAGTIPADPLKRAAVARIGPAATEPLGRAGASHWNVGFALSKTAHHPDALDMALAKVAAAAGAPPAFPQAARGRISIALPAGMSARTLAKLRRSLMSTPGIDAVSFDRADARKSADPTDGNLAVVGLIIMPKPSAHAQGFVAASGELSAAGLEQMRTLLGIPLAGSRAMAGGMVTLRFAGALDAAQANAARLAAAGHPLVEWVDLDLVQHRCGFRTTPTTPTTSGTCPAPGASADRRPGTRR